MPSVADIKPVEAVQLLVIAKSKIGKTEGAATWPRPIFFDFDNGIRVVRSPEFRARHPKVDTSAIRYEVFTERKLGAMGVVTEATAFDDACRFFDACMGPTKEWISPRDGSKMTLGADTFDTFVVDSVTSLFTAAVNKTIILTGKADIVGKRNVTTTYEGAKKTGLISLEGSDYASSQSLVEQFIDMLRTTKKHLIFLAHEQTITNKEGVPTGYEIMATGKSVEKIPLRFDEVYFIKMSPDGADADGKVRYKRSLQTHADGYRKAGTRLGVPDGTAWTYEAISNAIANLSTEK